MARRTATHASQGTLSRILQKNMRQWGIRSGNREEYDYVRENNIKFSAEDVISNGIKKVIEDEMVFNLLLIDLYHDLQAASFDLVVSILLTAVNHHVSLGKLSYFTFSQDVNRLMLDLFLEITDAVLENHH